MSIFFAISYLKPFMVGESNCENAATTPPTKASLRSWLLECATTRIKHSKTGYLVLFSIICASSSFACETSFVASLPFPYSCSSGTSNGARIMSMIKFSTRPCPKNPLPDLTFLPSRKFFTISSTFFRQLSPTGRNISCNPNPSPFFAFAKAFKIASCASHFDSENIWIG